MSGGITWSCWLHLMNLHYSGSNSHPASLAARGRPVRALSGEHGYIEGLSVDYPTGRMKPQPPPGVAQSAGGVRLTEYFA